MARLDPRRLGVYIVTSATPGTRGHAELAAAAVAGGATAVQLRAPEHDDERLLALSTRIAPICRDEGVLFIVNDRIGVAIAGAADGVHLGQRDDREDARERLGPERVLGVSVNTVEEARRAEAEGADYLGVTVWPTPSKPEAVPAGLEGLREVAAATALPVVGIGGIDAGNAGDVLAAGADGVAVIGAVAAADDPADAVRALRAAVDRFFEDQP